MLKYASVRLTLALSVEGVRPHPQCINLNKTHGNPLNQKIEQNRFPFT